MRPIVEWPGADRRAIIGLFTDIDDTLTTQGAITPDVLLALAQLRDAGLHVIAITGRPVGWSEPLARDLPVDAIVAENGSVALVGSRRIYMQSEAERATNCACMQQVAQRILREIPGTRLAQDSAGRETDIAVDHSEFTQLPQKEIDAVCALMRSEGMNATVSSIHINGWYGTHSKLAGARWIVRELFSRDLDSEVDRWVYIGDSPNDVLMFEHFPHSVGVANIMRFRDQLTHEPKYVTRGERGAGFVEFAATLVRP